MPGVGPIGTASVWTGSPGTAIPTSGLLGAGSGSGGLLWPVVLYLALFFLTLHLVDRLANRKPPGENG